MADPVRHRGRATAASRLHSAACVGRLRLGTVGAFIFIFPLCWRMLACWTSCPELEVPALLRDGWAGGLVGGWVGGLVEGWVGGRQCNL